MLEYARQAQLLGIPDQLLPGFFSADAALDRIGRVYRFDLEIQSHIEITVPKGTDSEQVRSGRAPIELETDLSKIPASGGILARRFSTNIDLVSLDLKVDGTWRPVLQTGKLKFNWLKLIPEYPEPDNPNVCPPPKAPDRPNNVRVYCGYKVTDPVPTMEVYSKEMGWMSAPSDIWGSAYPLFHDDELINILDLTILTAPHSIASCPSLTNGITWEVS